MSVTELIPVILIAGVGLLILSLIVFIVDRNQSLSALKVQVDRRG